MFGFLKGDRCDAAYRRVYAGCCSVQHEEFGIASLFFLSYEAIFVYLLAVDRGQIPPPPAEAVTCCRLSKSQRIQEAVEPQHAKFVAAFGILLAGIKLDDDVQDDNSWLAKFARWRLSGRINQARDYFATLDSSFDDRVSEYLLAHKKLEATAQHSIESYVEPTATAFAYIFSLSAQICGPGRSVDNAKSIEKVLADVGRLIGAALIAFDCAADWSRDRRIGSYNPLPTPRARVDAKLFCQRCLAQAIWLCSDRFGEESRCAAVLRTTFDRVAGCSMEDEIATAKRHRPAFALPRFRNGQLLRPGDCDCGCACDGCCQVADCCISDGSLCSDCSSSPACCCECGPGCDCGPCCDSYTMKKSKRDQQQLAEPTLFVGKRGKTVGPLKPTGLVELEGEHHPAKCETSTWVDDGVEVIVTAESANGLTVRPA